MRPLCESAPPVMSGESIRRSFAEPHRGKALRVQLENRIEKTHRFLLFRAMRLLGLVCEGVKRVAPHDLRQVRAQSLGRVEHLHSGRGSVDGDDDAEKEPMSDVRKGMVRSVVEMLLTGLDREAPGGPRKANSKGR